MHYFIWPINNDVHLITWFYGFDTKTSTNFLYQTLISNEINQFVCRIQTFSVLWCLGSMWRWWATVRTKSFDSYQKLQHVNREPKGREITFLQRQLWLLAELCHLGNVLNSHFIHVCDIMINLAKWKCQILKIRSMTFPFDNFILTSLMTHKQDLTNLAWIAFIVW